MVPLVDILVKRTPMKRPMCPVVEHVLEDEEERELSCHEGDRGERNLVCGHAEVAADRVEEVDQGELAGEVGDEDDFGAFPELGVGDVFVL